MDDIYIVDYNPLWTSLFAEEAARIQQALGDDLIVEIEHIGSTAVPGLAAKPIIDIMVGVRSLIDAQPAIPALEKLGYVYWYDNPNTDRMFFVKGMPPYGKQRTHHVHIVQHESEFWQRKFFRDYLRMHPEEVQRYAALKRELAERFRSDREAYTDGKRNYIQGVMEKAQHERII
jgi:GrpB-like predicted nucleotidyltransferase (UPF0157 family)